MNAMKRQQSCFSSDYLIKSLIFACKRLLSSSVSSQISAFLSYMTGSKAVSHAYAARYKLHIAVERRKKKTKRIPRINHDLNIRFNRHCNCRCRSCCKKKKHCSKSTENLLKVDEFPNRKRGMQCILTI